jgi:integral membrane protein
MMILHSQKPLLAAILLLLPLLIGLPVLINGMLARKRRVSEGAKLEEVVHPERTRLRQLGTIEAISFLLLMGVAVPLKRMTGDGTWVTIVGSLHGALFLLYLAAVLIIAPALRWRPLTIFLALVASVVPFGPFLFEAFLPRLEKPASVSPSAKPVS